MGPPKRARAAGPARLAATGAPDILFRRTLTKGHRAPNSLARRNGTHLPPAEFAGLAELVLQGGDAARTLCVACRAKRIGGPRGWAHWPILACGRARLRSA